MAEASLNLLVLRTAQEDVLKTFYESLGLKFSKEKHGKGPSHLTATSGAVLLEIYPLMKGAKEADSSLRLGFLVQDLKKTFDALSKLGTPIKQVPEQTEWGYRGVVQDPDGRTVELTQAG